MPSLTLKNFLRLSLLVSFILGLCFCGIFCYSMAKVDYSRLIQSITNSKQAEIIELELEVNKFFKDLQEKLLEAHNFDQKNISETELRERIKSVSSEYSVNGIQHDVILLNTHTKRNIFRAFRRYFAGKVRIPSMRGRFRKCRRDPVLTDQLKMLSIQLEVDRSSQKIWLSKKDLMKLDRLDSVTDQTLNHADFTECLRKTVMNFHYDSYIHSKVDEDEIRDFWKNIRENRPSSFAQLLERQTEELPELFKSFSYLDFLLVSNALSSSILLIPEGVRFEKFFKNRLEIDPLKAMIQFMEIQGYLVHLQLYNRPWPNKPIDAMSLLADGVSLVKIDKQILEAEMIKRIEALGYEVNFDSDSTNYPKVFSTLLGKHIFWKKWQSEIALDRINQYWVLIFIALMVINTLMGFLVFRLIIKPLEKNIENLLSDNFQPNQNLPRELAEVEAALRQMKSNQDVFQSELLIRSASLQVLQNPELSADQMLERISTIVGKIFEGTHIQKLEIPSKKQNVITIQPPEDVSKILVENLNLKFPISFVIRSKKSLPQRILTTCKELLEKIYISLSVHVSEQISHAYAQDIDATKEFNELRLKSSSINFGEVKVDITVSPYATVFGDGYEMVECGQKLFVFVARTHSSAPANTILTHTLRSYLRGVVSTEVDLQESFDRLCAYSYELYRDSSFEQSFCLLSIDGDLKQIQYAGTGDMRFRVVTRDIPNSDWINFTIKSKQQPDLIRTLSLESEIRFELGTTDGTIHVDITEDKRSNV